MSRIPFSSLVAIANFRLCVSLRLQDIFHWQFVSLLSLTALIMLYAPGVLKELCKSA